MKTYQKIGEICNLENPKITDIIKIIKYNLLLCDSIFVQAAKYGIKNNL